MATGPIVYQFANMEFDPHGQEPLELDRTLEVSPPVASLDDIAQIMSEAIKKSLFFNGEIEADDIDQSIHDYLDLVPYQGPAQLDREVLMVKGVKPVYQRNLAVVTEIWKTVRNHPPGMFFDYQVYRYDPTTGSFDIYQQGYYYQ